MGFQSHSTEIGATCGLWLGFSSLWVLFTTFNKGGSSRAALQMLLGHEWHGTISASQVWAAGHTWSLRRHGQNLPLFHSQGTAREYNDIIRINSRKNLLTGNSVTSALKCWYPYNHLVIHLITQSTITQLSSHLTTQSSNYLTIWPLSHPTFIVDSHPGIFCSGSEYFSSYLLSSYRSFLGTQ